MRYNKFVILSESDTKEGGEARIKCAPCEFHLELIEKGAKCFGGGMYIEKPEKSELLLYGKSVDYGEPQFYGWNSLVMLDKKYEGWKIVYVKNIEDLNHAVRVDLTNKIIFRK